MNTIRILAAGFVAALAASPSLAAADNALVYGNVSSWTILTDPAHSYRCFAEVLYEGGTSIRVGYNSADGGLYLSVTDPAWHGIRAGASHDAALQFDDASSLRLPGIGTTAGGADAGVILAIPPASRQAFLDDFMARHALTVSIAGRAAIELSLAGSLRAARMLEECQSSMPRHAQTGE